jgi:hypothetical protein
MYDEHLLRAFQQELWKLGAPSILPARLSSVLSSAGALGGIGAGVGGVAGAVHGGVKNYRAAKAEGADTRGALLHGAMGAAGGVGKGAVIGAGIGGVAGAGASLANAGKAEAMRAALTDRSAFARFGQRQVHGVTGAVPQGGLGQLKMDAADRAEQLKHLTDRLKADPNSMQPGIIDRARGLDAKTVGAKALERAQQSASASQAAQDAGLTSVPGLVKSLVKSPTETARLAWNHQMHGADGVTKAMMATSGIGVAQTMANREEGEGRLHHAGRVAGSAAGAGLGILTGGMPQMTQMGLGTLQHKYVPELGGMSRHSSRLGGAVAAPPQVGPVIQ